jgi:TetR/AcrR family transcriptional regulator, lmrAB and yxaGH operons repressor
MTTKRDQIVNTACHLMEHQGYHATGLNQILTESGAPKGSLYYYFPGGKEELTVEAIERTSLAITKRLQESMDNCDPPAMALKAFLYSLAGYIEASNYGAGGPITAIAIEAASISERLRLACRDAYCSWQAVLEEKFIRSGFPAERAKRLATLVIAAIEGAIILCRSEKSVAPLHAVAHELEGLLQHC